MSPVPVSILPEQIAGKPTLFGPTPKRAPTRQKLTCPECSARAWVPPETEILCGRCEVAMMENAP